MNGSATVTNHNIVFNNKRESHDSSFLGNISLYDLQHPCLTSVHLELEDMAEEAIPGHVITIVDIFINCVMISLIGVFGIVGNSLNIAVLYRHGFRESTNIVLVSLSVSDLLFSVMLPITKLRCIIQDFDMALAISVDTFVTVIFFMPKFVAAANSFCHIALIAVERFTAVYLPLQVSMIFTPKVMKILVSGSYVVTIMLLSPTFFAYDYEWRYDENLNRTVALLKPTRYYEANKSFLDLYMWVILNNLICTLSTVIVLACCLAIGLKLIFATIKREKMTSRATGYDVRVVKMLVTVCAVYLVVQIPSILLFMYFVPDFVTMSPVAKLASDVSDLLLAVNASINFLVYVSMSEKFAKTYKKMLGFA